MREELFDPLGLRGTGFCEGSATVPGRAQDYEVGRAGLVATPYWHNSGFFAAGGLCSTVVDLGRWQTALDEGRVVTPATLAEMSAPTPLPDGVEVDYGYGVRRGRFQGHVKRGHTGGGRSNRAALARYPDDGLTVVVLLNTERSDAPVVAIDIEARLARRVFEEPMPSPHDLALTAEDAARFAGEYHGSPPLRVSAGPAGLRLQRGRRRPGVALLAQGNGVFLNGEQPAVELRFLPEGAPRAGRVAIYDNGWFLALRTRR
jgi:CubicO group peptidase (beta-lactamase class C family)